MRSRARRNPPSKTTSLLTRALRLKSSTWKPPTIQPSAAIQVMQSYPTEHRKRFASCAVLMLMVLWICPRPVAHSHEEFGDSSPSAISLIEHLKDFHSKGSFPDKAIHVHWVLNNGSVLLASCNAPSPTIITSLSSIESAALFLCTPELNDPSVDLVATQSLSSILSLEALPSRRTSQRVHLLRATLQPSLLSLSCLLSC